MAAYHWHLVTSSYSFNANDVIWLIRKLGSKAKIFMQITKTKCEHFFTFFNRSCPILGPLVALFWISGDVSPGFQSQSSGFCLIHHIAEANVMYIPEIHLWCYTLRGADQVHILPKDIINSDCRQSRTQDRWVLSPTRCQLSY